MARVQLNLKLRPELVARLREEAAAAGCTLVALAERRLAGEVPDPVPDQVSDRLAALERRVAELEERTPPEGSGPVPARVPDQVPPAPSMPMEEELLAPLDAVPGQQLSTPELAELLGVTRNALNNWVARNRPGAERDGWRLVGRARSSAGGPPRWLWERATT